MGERRWWWPEQRGKRGFYTWHVTWDGQPDVTRLVLQCQGALATMQDVDLVPDVWLHTALPGTGFRGRPSDETLGRILAAAAGRLAALPAPRVTLAAPVADAGTVLIPIQPAASIVELRDAVRAATAEVLPGSLAESEEFTPHVPLAYTGSGVPDARVTTALQRVDAGPVTVSVPTAELVVVTRAHLMFEWSTIAELPLGR